MKPILLILILLIFSGFSYEDNPKGYQCGGGYTDENGIDLYCIGNGQFPMSDDACKCVPLKEAIAYWCKNGQWLKLEDCQV